jgi:hypothetical protein
MSIKTSPKELLKIVNEYNLQPPITRWNLILDENNNWGIKVWLVANAKYPIPFIEKLAKGFKVVYEYEK